MADPLSAIASAASIAGLADVTCRLAGSLYKSFQAVKEAPQNIKRLSKELEQFQSLLHEVDNLVKRYDTCPSVVENGLSTATVLLLLQDCKAELDEVGKTTARFRKDSSLLKDVAECIKRVVEMQKIDRHCRAIDALGRRIGVALSVVGRQHDITTSERQKVLQSQVTDTRDVFQTSLKETRDQVSTELSTVQTGIEQVASKVIQGQDETRTNLRINHDRLRREFLTTGRRSFRRLNTIRNEVRDVTLLTRRAHWQSSQDQRRLNRSISHIESMLSELSSIRLESQANHLKSALARDSQLDSIMLSLMLMRSSLYCAVSQLKSAALAKVSEEAGKFMLDEFERLVAFGHKAWPVPDRQIFDDFPNASVTSKRQRRTLSHFSTLGCLEVRFEEMTGDCIDMPRSTVIASFKFIPNLNVHSTGVFAFFQKETQMASKPSISRTLREIRQIVRDDDQVGRPLVAALIHDDLPSVQRMLSSGRVRPWDRDWGGRDLLKMAAWVGGSGKILEYLLKIIGHSVDSIGLQWWILANFAVRRINDSSILPSHPPMRGDLQSYIELFRRAIDIKQTLDDGFIIKVPSKDHGFVQLLQLDRREIFGGYDFLIDREANIEFKDPWGETPLLEVAGSDFEDSPSWIWALLQCGADPSAVDFKDRNSLHLTLRYSKVSCGTPCRQYSISWVGLQVKLVHLLKAGCPIHAIDNRGRSPTDYARGLKLKNVWVSSLRELDMLDDDVLESLYNKPGCSVVDSDSDSCCSWNFDEEQDDEYEEDEEDNECEDDMDNNEAKRTEDPIDQDIRMVNGGVASSRGKFRHTRRMPHQAQTSTAESRSLLEADVPSAKPEMRGDSIIALGQHHIWI